MALKINLYSTDNVSLQIGDTAYYISNVDDTTTSITYSPKETDGEPNIPIKIGEITAIGNNNITIETFIGEPEGGDFIMFSKNKAANNTSLLGYYAEVKLSNNSTEKAELFALGSEIAASSK